MDPKSSKWVHFRFGRGRKPPTRTGCPFVLSRKRIVTIPVASYLRHIAVITRRTRERPHRSLAHSSGRPGSTLGEVTRALSRAHKSKVHAPTRFFLVGTEALSGLVHLQLR